jgi:hypothetical protein
LDKNTTFLRYNPRNLKSATNRDAIKRVLEKYIDFQNLYIRREFKVEPVEFLDRPEDDILVLRLNRPIEEDHLEIYTVVRGRFIDFNLEIVSPADPSYPANSYVTRILSCSIALDKREHDRSAFEGDFPRATNIATIKIKERESDFRKSLSVRMIVEEYINRIEGVDVKKVNFKDDKDLTPAVSYVMESGRTLRIADTSDTSGFFKDNEQYFEKTNSAELRDDLRLWLQNNSANIKSLLVKPILYHPLVGPEFPIAYLSIINRDAPISDSDSGRIDSFMEELSERIRNGNLVDSKAEGKIIDVSTGGVKIELDDAKMIDKLISQSIVVLDMNFKQGASIIISGRIVWVYKNENRGFLAGIDFRGSRFGPGMKGALAIHVKDFLSSKNKRAELMQ